MNELLIDGVRIAYEEKGSGQPVALLNGVMMTTASWAYQVRDLVPSYRCILHDCRGQLRSDKPGGYTMAGHAEDFRALLDHLEIARCHVIGTSYGGEIGMIFAARYPERVASLSVIASVSHIEPPLETEIRDWIAAADDRGGFYRAVLADNYSPGFVEKGSALLEAAEARIEMTYPDDFFPAFQDLCRAFLELDIRDQLHAIRAPSLIMVGAEDRLKVPAYSRYLVDHIPDARLSVIPEAGHVVVIEQPEAVNEALIAFLTEHEERI